LHISKVEEKLKGTPPRSVVILETPIEDRRSGIADVEKALQGGSSTKRGLGVGFGGARRIMDEFKIERKTDEGTTITAKKWKH